LPAPTGTLTLKRLSNGSVLGSKSVNANGSYAFTLPILPTGTVGLIATYSGDVNFDSSTSNRVDLAVQTDVVEATGVNITYSAFYPYRDGYRDTLAIRGNRNEPISVAINVYSPTGSRVKSVAIPSGTGPYSYAWTGRNSAGSVLVAGKYKVIQTLRDSAGIKMTITSYVNLSRKRLYYYTAYVTKLGKTISSVGDSGTGSVYLSSTGYAKLVGKYPYGWVGVGYQFSLPAAAVYKSFYFQIYSKGAYSVPPSQIAMQNFQACAYSSAWDVSCFNRWNSAVAANSVAAWASTSGLSASNRYNRIVRGIVSVPYGTLYVYKARIKVIYGLLK
jgi:hypothetical protein